MWAPYKTDCPRRWKLTRLPNRGSKDCNLDEEALPCNSVLTANQLSELVLSDGRVVCLRVCVNFDVLDEVFL